MREAGILEQLSHKWQKASKGQEISEGNCGARIFKKINKTFSPNSCPSIVCSTDIEPTSQPNISN
jgi:hypothetical protein